MFLIVIVPLDFLFWLYVIYHDIPELQAIKVNFV